MNAREVLRPDSTAGALARGLQVVLVGLIGYGAAVGKGAVVVNGALALPFAFLPSLLEWRYDHEMDPRLSVWIAGAAVAHVIGFFGPYTAQTGLLKWYDQAAHAITASFVAGVGYALVGALDRSSERLRFPGTFRFVLTLCLVMAFGVAWETLEFGAAGLASLLGNRSALVQYGLDDIVFDLAFNTLAAAIVATAGTDYFRDITAIVSEQVLGGGDA